MNNRSYKMTAFVHDLASRERKIIKGSSDLQGARGADENKMKPLSCKTNDAVKGDL